MRSLYSQCPATCYLLNKNSIVKYQGDDMSHLKGSDIIKWMQGKGR